MRKNAARKSLSFRRDERRKLRRERGQATAKSPPTGYREEVRRLGSRLADHSSSDPRIGEVSPAAHGPTVNASRTLTSPAD
jgi:hypothetical protein